MLVHGAGVGRRAAWVICMAARRNPVGRPILQHLGRQMHLNQSNNPDKFLGFLAQDWEIRGKIKGGIGSEDHMPGTVPNALHIPKSHSNALRQSYSNFTSGAK